MTGLARLSRLALLRAAHPWQAALVAGGLAGGAAAAGRPAREVALTAGTALVGQAVQGWHNDLVDRRRDRRHLRPGKPLAQGWVEPGTVWFALACGVLLLVPLSVSHGPVAGATYLLAVLCGIAGNLVLRDGWASWLPWAAQYALYPVLLTHGGWDGQPRTETGEAAAALAPGPLLLVCGVAALLGVLAHLVRAVPGLSRDHQDGARTLAVRLARRWGARALAALAVTGTLVTYAAAVVLLATA